MTELQFQKQITKYLRDNGYIYYHLQNTRGRYDSDKGQNGNPDLCIALKNGKTLYLELKNKGKRLSDIQEQKIEQLKSHAQIATWYEMRDDAHDLQRIVELIRELEAKNG